MRQMTAMLLLGQTKLERALYMVGWYVYIVRCADGSLYTGITKDVESRVSLHNAGRGAKYTRARRPVELVYREMVSDRGAAVRRECAIKRLRPIAKRKLITKSGEPKSTQEIRSLQ